MFQTIIIWRKSCSRNENILNIFFFCLNKAQFSHCRPFRALWVRAVRITIEHFHVGPCRDWLQLPKRAKRVRWGPHRALLHRSDKTFFCLPFFAFLASRLRESELHSRHHSVNIRRKKKWRWQHLCARDLRISQPLMRVVICTRFHIRFVHLIVGHSVALHVTQL